MLTKEKRKETKPRPNSMKGTKKKKGKATAPD